MIETIAELEFLYGTPALASTVKVADHLTPEYSKWIEASPFCAICTVGADGTDASPRGDTQQVAFVLDQETLAIPDRRGNNRIDTLRNIVEDGRVSLMFLTPGSGTVTRVNGTAYVTAEVEVLERFVVQEQLPRTVIIIKVAEVYFQCARAVMRSGVWIPDSWPDLDQLPTVGKILETMSKGDVDAAQYDSEWPSRAEKTLW